MINKGEFMNRIEIKQISRQQLSVNYGLTLFFVLIPWVILGLAATTIVGALLAAPLIVGSSYGLLLLYRGVEPNQQDLLVGYDSKKMVQNIIQLFLTSLYVVLWSFLLIIPGIIKSYSYAMVPFLLADPDVQQEDVITLSRQMMDGKKMDLFILQLSFIGWAILGVFTLNILNFLYTIPYMQLATAGFYQELKMTTY
jgi:uncharacterized membrane protein